MIPQSLLKALLTWENCQKRPLKSETNLKITYHWWKHLEPKLVAWDSCIFRTEAATQPSSTYTPGCFSTSHGGWPTCGSELPHCCQNRPAISIHHELQPWHYCHEHSWMRLVHHAHQRRPPRVCWDPKAPLDLSPVDANKTSLKLPDLVFEFSKQLLVHIYAEHRSLRTPIDHPRSMNKVWKKRSDKHFLKCAFPMGCHVTKGHVRLKKCTLSYFQHKRVSYDQLLEKHR